MQGLLTWSLRTEYHERLTQTFNDLEELNTHIAAMTQQYEGFVRARQAATHSYVGYDAAFSRLRRRVEDELQRVNVVQARQGHILEMVAINELGIRRDRLQAYQAQARYAVADSYDRATRAQADGEQH